MIFYFCDLDKVLELVGGDALGDGIDVGQGLGGALEGVKRDGGAH